VEIEHKNPMDAKLDVEKIKEIMSKFELPPPPWAQN
jgi:hypothetical protein